MSIKVMDPDRFEKAPVRVVVYLERRKYEEAEQVARILGMGSVERLIPALLEKTVEELKVEGCRIKPYWDRG